MGTRFGSAGACDTLQGRAQLLGRLESNLLDLDVQSACSAIIGFLYGKTAINRLVELNVAFANIQTHETDFGELLLLQQLVPVEVRVLHAQQQLVANVEGVGAGIT